MSPARKPQHVNTGVQMEMRHTQTGARSPAHRLGEDDRGNLVYQRVDGWELVTRKTVTLNADGNFVVKPTREEIAATVSKLKYLVTIRNQPERKTVVVAETPVDAAVAGAVKLGVRNCGRRPTYATATSPGSKLFSVYAPSPAGLATLVSCNCDVYVERVKR